MYLVQACILYSTLPRYATLLCGITFVSIDHSRDPSRRYRIFLRCGASGRKKK